MRPQVGKSNLPTKIRRPMRNLGLSNAFQIYERLLFNFKLISQLFCNITAFKTKIAPFCKVPHRCVPVALAIMSPPPTSGTSVGILLSKPRFANQCPPGCLQPQGSAPDLSTMCHRCLFPLTGPCLKCRKCAPLCHPSATGGRRW